MFTIIQGGHKALTGSINAKKHARLDRIEIYIQISENHPEKRKKLHIAY